MKLIYYLYIKKKKEEEIFPLRHVSDWASPATAYKFLCFILTFTTNRKIVFSNLYYRAFATNLKKFYDFFEVRIITAIK